MVWVFAGLLKKLSPDEADAQTIKQAVLTAIHP